MNLGFVNSNLFYLILFVLLPHRNIVSGDHVLFLATCSTYSHRVAQWPLIEGLIAKGHNVTYISPWGPSGQLSNPNVTEIVPQELTKLATELLKGHFDVNYRVYGILPPLFAILDLFCYQVCDAALSSPEVQEWLNTNPEVDMVVGDMVSECSYGMSEKLGAKNVLFSPIPLLNKYFEAFGINPEISSVPDSDVTRTVPLSFFSRLTVSLLPLYYRVMDAIFFPWYRSLFKRALGLDNIKGVYEIKETTDLVIINGDYISDYARSWPKMVIKCEGIHIKKEHQKRPLEKEVETFINSKNSNGLNNDGFVFMSFGTVAKAPNLPLEFRQLFFETIESFPNIKFIWKWDGQKPESYPTNLFLVPWIDQQDVLAHPKIRAFLTQSGRPSTQEALYNEVPLITFPILGDQDFNAQRSAGLGYSVPLDFAGLTKEKLKDAIGQILNEKKYKEKATQLSKLAKDVPMDPIDVAVWWVEFALRHKKEELDLLKPLSRHLYWYQKRDLDVWAFIFILCCIGSYITFYLVRKFFNRFIIRGKNSIKNSNLTKKSQ